MTRQDIFDSLKTIISYEFGNSKDDINEGSIIYDDLMIDELDRISLVMAIEREHDIAIPDEKTENWNCVGDILNYLEHTELRDR